MKKVLTIAGSDCSGGAGIQADLKTMTMHGVYAMSAITVLTAQNTTGVFDIMEVSPAFLHKELTCIFDDIYPDAIKIGMVSNEDLIEEIANMLTANPVKYVVLDPVMVSTSGSALLKEGAKDTLLSKLVPKAFVVTPNIPEAEILSGEPIHSKQEMEHAAKTIGSRFGVNVLVKGGHAIEDANDVLYVDGAFHWFEGNRINNSNTHGTGCTLSSAIASNLALGFDLVTSIENSKKYLSEALLDGMDLGKGSGPLNHMYAIRKSEEE